MERCINQRIFLFKFWTSHSSENGIPRRNYGPFDTKVLGVDVAEKERLAATVIPLCFLLLKLYRWQIHSFINNTLSVFIKFMNYIFIIELQFMCKIDIGIYYLFFVTFVKINRNVHFNKICVFMLVVIRYCNARLNLCQSTFLTHIKL